MRAKILPSDRWLQMCVWVLTVFGVVMVYDASYAHALAFYDDAWFFAKKQAFSAVLGLAAMAVFARYDHRRLLPKAPWAYVVSLALLVLVWKAGHGALGGQRWLRLGPIQFQPSELAKLSLVLMVAAVIARFPMVCRRPGPFALLCLVAGTPILMTERQPDLGTAVTMVLSVGAMILVAGVRARFMATVAALGALFVVFAILMPSKGGHSAGEGGSYRMRRLTSFIDPGSQRDGAGMQNWHSLVALGNGGVRGVGLSNSLEKRVGGVPMQRTDFIYAIVGEEFGLVGTVGILTLFLVIGVRGYGIACRCRDPFGQLIAVGITSLICGQAALNIAVVTSSIPNTGIPLPFISYGGSALIPTLAGIGILLNISRIPFGSPVAVPERNAETEPVH